MSQPDKIVIPANIQRLRTVRAGQVFNNVGNFVDVGNITPSNLETLLPHAMNLLRHECAGHYEILNVRDLTPEGVKLLGDENKEVADFCHQSALRDQRQARVGYGISAVTGVASLSFGVVSASKTLSLLEMPSCSAQKSMTVVEARCSSLDYAQSRTDLKVDAGLSGLGAVVLGMGTFMAVRFGVEKSVRMKVNLVKAALSLGNFMVCETALGNANGAPSPQP